MGNRKDINGCSLKPLQIHTPCHNMNISEFYFLQKSIIHQNTYEMAYLIPTTIFYFSYTSTKCNLHNNNNNYYHYNNQSNSGMDQVTSKKGIKERTRRYNQCLLFMSISTNHYYFVSYFY